MLRNSKDLRICNVLMPKTTYRLGETINCVLNLSNAETYLIKVQQSPPSRLFLEEKEKKEKRKRTGCVVCSEGFGGGVARRVRLR